MPDNIQIIGARHHNLKGFSVAFPKNSLSIVTGLSGSGKSTLAFDTLYAEGQRRYVESLSNYARQFLDRLQKPDVDRIEGLSPAIAIQQRSGQANPRSIVATTTEIHDYLRLLFTHIGKPHCPHCGRRVSGQSAEQICEHLQNLPEQTRFILMAPYVRGKTAAPATVIEQVRRDGFVRARIDGNIVRLEDEEPDLSKNTSHTIEAVVDRLISGRTSRERLNDSVELALRLGEGILTVSIEDASEGWREEVFSQHLACPDCGIEIDHFQPRDFSFNSPYGACHACGGLGTILTLTPDRLVPYPQRSLKKGAIPLLKFGSRRVIRHYNHLLKCLADHYGFTSGTPWEKIDPEIRNILLYGSGEEIISFDYWRGGRLKKNRKPFEGFLPMLNRRFRETQSERVRQRLRKDMIRQTCHECRGRRLKPESLAVTVGGASIDQFCRQNITQAGAFLDNLELSDEEAKIADNLLHEIRQRLRFLQSVGLEYLTLDRESHTLSGGESQRIRLATQIGSGLTGVLYIFDEPTIGLHQRDNRRLIETLEKLRDLGNSVVVVEHDLPMIREADWIVDLGPGAGVNGGHLVKAGTPSEVKACPESLTGAFLRNERQVPLPSERKTGTNRKLTIRRASEHNLKNVDVSFPLGTLCCVTGVSGSGKSTLVNTILRNALWHHFQQKSDAPGQHKALEGAENISKMLVIDQSPIGRTPRSNPATYTDIFADIREFFAKVPEARKRGYKAGRFSFNVKGGRCEECRGDGVKRIEMHFLPDAYVTCEACRGKRYNRETLLITYRGHSIADVLDMTVNEAYEFFNAIPKLKRKLGMLASVGLGYIHLGQPATTLSGGEAQRVKLAAELGRQTKGHTLYLLDEPTTGLHAADVEQLLDVLYSLRDKDNTVLIIEHNPDVIKVADHIIDLGPEGGDGGGYVVTAGTPEDVSRCRASYTGALLSDILA